jgi:hypothetical protein
MATPFHKAKQGVPAPGSEATLAQNSDAVQTLVIHLKVTGTAANVLADWNTILATNFASPSAEASWDKAQG